MCRGGALSFCSWGHNLLRPQGQASTDTWILERKPSFYCHILNRRPEDVVQLVKYLLNIKNSLDLQKASMVTDTYNLSTEEVGAGGSEVQMYPPLRSEYELCLGHLRLYLEKLWRENVGRLGEANSLSLRSLWCGLWVVSGLVIYLRGQVHRSQQLFCAHPCVGRCLFCDTLLTCSDSVENTTTFKVVFFFNISFFMILVE